MLALLSENNSFKKSLVFFPFKKFSNAKLYLWPPDEPGAGDGSQEPGPDE